MPDSPDDFILDLTATPDAADRAYVLDHLKAFNDAQSEVMRAGRAQDAQLLHVYLRDQQGQIMGGLIASTYWHWLDIDLFWLDETVRRHGWGARLIQAAEAEARQRGCQWSKVGTFSFQARGFYEKQGYRVVGQVDDYPPGATDFTLRKDLM